ncbi:putative magnesium transporter NIPA4 [Hypsizygus marmoreus]|uniref:Magnesium transporter NIPA4 n=1 Tax=Hypsizygus marmoreus TaxID=39966 RepID=A0A369J0R8_HYPMA|nr:putative magnesium transporter NIPA4 [Hypsizygus marmoreus]
MSSSVSSMLPSTTATALAETTSAATKTLSAGKNLKVVGIILAVVSGLLIGSSFVFKKKGLLRSQAGGPAGEGVAYLKSPLWWLGMTMMILGEICNFAAYAFVEAIVVTPLGALSVVICAILSSIFLKETLTFFGWLGCGLCIIGSVTIALNGPQEESVGQIREFQKLFLSPGFLAYSSILIATSIVIVIFFAPKYGKKSMLWYIFVCSMIGGISVSVTTGLGAAIVQTALGDNQFKYWFMYFLLIFVIVTLLTEVYYLNVALALFNTAMVTPTYYVIFTFFSMVTTIVLFKGLHAGVMQILTIVMGFLTICVGIIILQMSKVDPVSLNKLDRRSTLLLQAARSKTEAFDEKSHLGVEDPGMDALRGSFGTIGSIIRARSARRLSQSSAQTNYRIRPAGAGAPYDRDSSLPPWLPTGGSPSMHPSPLHDGITRHQLYDAPVPHPYASDMNSTSSVNGSPTMAKRPTIKFDSQDVVHQYDRPGTGDDKVTEHRKAVGSPVAPSYPPLPTRPYSSPEGLPAMSSSVSNSDAVDLLGIEGVPLSTVEEGGSSASSAGASASGSRQTLLLPSSRFAHDNEVHSAPPSLAPRFARPGGPGRLHSRDIFDQSTSTGTLLSFPSVTDSARSGTWDDDDTKSSNDNHKRDGSERGRTSKRYPKGAGDDDREESMSLWQRDGGNDDDDDNKDGASPLSPPEPSPGGIRLVTPQPRVGSRF